MNNPSSKIPQKELSNDKQKPQDEEKDAYDICINITGFEDLGLIKEKNVNGWKIESKENIDNFTTVPNCVVGVLGEVNSGKTFILNKIGGTKLPYERTKGISVFFPKDKEKSKGFCFLDTSGFGREISLEKAPDEKRIIELNRDRKLTENLISEIVLTYSNIIIVVISQFNFDAQIYLNKIKKTVKNKAIFVIHNLSSAESKEEVNQYISNYLKKSKTFNVLKENMLEIKEQGEDIFDSYYKEPKPITDNNIQHHHHDDDDDEEEEEKNEVLHFLMMNDDAKDSKYYNTAPIKYLRNQIICCSSKVPFHPLNALKETLNKIFKDNGREDLYNSLETSNNKVVLNEKKANKLDSLGAFFIEKGQEQINEKGFTPYYRTYFDKEKKFFIVELRVRGELKDNNKILVDDNEIKSKISIEGKDFIFIYGWDKKKPPEKSNNEDFKRAIPQIKLGNIPQEFSNRKYGRYYLSFKVSMNKLPLKARAIVKAESQKGITKFYYELKRS